MGLLNNLFGNGSGSNNRSMPSSGFNQQPSSSGSGRINFQNGVYNGGFDKNLRYNVRNDLYGTLNDRSARNSVADLFYESRGGKGVTKDELRSGLRRLVSQNKMSEKQMWAVRGKYNL
jgi:hypothetical protein